MKSRLERYNVDESSEKKQKRSSRLSRNQHLYDDLNNKIGFEEIVDFNTQTKIELSSLNEPKKSRESYQQLKDYQSLMRDNKEKEEIVEEEKEKVFDINSILEEARKNRSEIDELEKKRKLKSDEYNVLSDLNKKYLSSKKDQQDKDEYEGLEELINTITSKTLASDIKEQEQKEEQDLLGDLVATNVELQVKAPSDYEMDSSNNLTTIIPKEDDEEEEQTVDNSFYTRSMDLSEQDFDFDEEIEHSSSIKKRILIIAITIILLAIIAVVIYFVLQHFGIKIDISQILK